MSEDANSKPARAVKNTSTPQPGLLIKMVRPFSNVFGKASAFVLGVGFTYFVFYNNFMVYLKKSDELMKNELLSIKRLIEDSQAHEAKQKKSGGNSLI